MTASEFSSRSARTRHCWPSRKILPEAGDLFLTSLRRRQDDWNELLASLADLHVNGVPIDFAGFDRPYSRRRVTIPTYAFDRQRYWAAATPRVRPDAGEVPATVEGTADAASSFIRSLGSRRRMRPVRLGTPREFTTEGADRFKRVALRARLRRLRSVEAGIRWSDGGFRCKALIQLGFDATPGRQFNVVSETTKLGIAKKFTRLFHLLIDTLAGQGVLSGSGPDYVVTSLPQGDPIARSAEMLKQFSELGSEIAIVGRCGPELARVLVGVQDPLKLLFDEAGFEHLRKLYADRLSRERSTGPSQH